MGHPDEVARLSRELVGVRPGRRPELAEALGPRVPHDSTFAAEDTWRREPGLTMPRFSLPTSAPAHIATVGGR